ncbi:thioredoxin family protein [Paenibacillus arenilitoris]|uniref:Thioredoxin family protein n=1 Tax=Paenibacillus arenilitoris TaxID=2772299 RepID=A0A927H6D9_9BACL|nr:thioredoxin family protein [Paenibacillus arenilitoris]MBD2869402.1 thioredoxin family protein [Paenibacillus arenilitoris]
MAIRDIDEAAAERLAHPDNGPAAVYFYTPLCGTCKLGERMLEIAVAAGADTPVAKLNINYAPHLRDVWRIASVPCLVLLQGGEPVRKEYAMKSVDSLYLLLKRKNPG